jgi:UrcA family protein
MKTLIVSAGLSLAALLPATAHAAPAETFIVTIPVYDINLATTTGAATLRERASVAAREVCNDYMKPLHDLQRASACRAAILSQVDDKITLASARTIRVMASR